MHNTKQCILLTAYCNYIAQKRCCRLDGWNFLSTKRKSSCGKMDNLKKKRSLLLSNVEDCTNHNEIELRVQFLPYSIIVYNFFSARWCRMNRSVRTMTCDSIRFRESYFWIRTMSPHKCSSTWGSSIRSSLDCYQTVIIAETQINVDFKAETRITRSLHTWIEKSKRSFIALTAFEIRL